MTSDEIQIIIQDYKYCKIICSDKEIYEELKFLLSFQQLGYEYTPQHKQYGWNGYIYLLNKKNQFYLGNLPLVEKFLTEKNVKYSVEDHRQKIIPVIPIDISKSLIKLNLVPRDYQNRIVETALQYNKGIIRASTGSGKSLCTALITAHINKPTIIYVIGLDLLKQFHDLYSSIFDEEIGYIGNGITNIKRINIASIWSIGRAVNAEDIIIDDEFIDDKEKFDENNKEKIIELLKATKLHIYDESHIITTNTIKSIFNIIEPEYMFGFSGTPYRDDGSDLLVSGILGDQIIDVSASELIEKGVLAQPNIKFVNVPPISGMYDHAYQTVYKEYIVENDYRNSLILNQTISLINKKYKVLVLFKQIKHGKILAEKFEQAGIKFDMLNGKNDLEQRTLVKNKLNNGEIDCVLASTIFDIGVDLPILSGLVLCGGGKSSIKTLQRIGRILRPYKNKKQVAIVDFYDDTKFLKHHSIKRYQIYSSEKGFNIFHNPKFDYIKKEYI